MAWAVRPSVCRLWCCCALPRYKFKKKLQFIHKLTVSDTSKTAKITKRWYYSAAHWHLGDVLQKLQKSDYLFVIFAVLDVSLTVNLCLNRSLHLFSIIRYEEFYRINLDTAMLLKCIKTTKLPYYYSWYSKVPNFDSGTCFHHERNYPQFNF